MPGEPPVPGAFPRPLRTAVDLSRIPVGDETVPELYRPLIEGLARASLPGAGRLDFEFVFADAAADGRELPVRLLVSTVEELTAEGGGADSPAYAPARPPAVRKAVWVRCAFTPPAGGAGSLARGGLLRPFAAADYSLAAGSTLTMFGVDFDPELVTSHLLSHVRFARPLPTDGSLSVELVHYRPNTPLPATGRLAAEAGKAVSRAVDAALLSAVPAAPPRTVGYFDLAALHVLVRWEHRSVRVDPAGRERLLGPAEFGQAPGVSGVPQLTANDEAGEFESTLAGLRSPDASARAQAEAGLAFGDLRLPPIAAERLEAALATDLPPRDLAVLLTLLGRAVAEHPRSKVTDVERVRALTGHADPRVALAARSALAEIRRSAAPEEPGTPAVGHEDLVIPLTAPAAADEDRQRKPGRPVRTVRRLDVGRFLSETVPALQVDLDRMHRPVVECFGELLRKLEGQAAETHEANQELVEAVMALARRFGVDLVFEHDGERHVVVIRCMTVKGRGVSAFIIRTRQGERYLAKSATWPRLIPLTSTTDSAR